MRTDDDDSVAAHLISRLRHRGPDREWFEQAGSYGLVQTRLSVIDLSDAVKYPIRNETGDLLLVFNGEIYDHVRWRAELQRQGHQFRTRCDAEVVVHGYEEYGASIFARLDGMFALALLHLPTQELLLTRDAAGIKPLVHTTGERFAFASDALALVAAGLSRGEVDEAAIRAYLACHYVPPPATGISDVRQVAPGEVLRYQADGTLTSERWRPKPFSGAPGGTPSSLEEVERALDESVRTQLVADVPVGVFLSSGLDSSLVLDSAVRSGARPTAFTIGFRKQPDYDESDAASRFARHLGVEHVVGELSLGFADTLDEISRAFDSPLADASAIATLQLARLTRSRVTVALSGTGGDDLFAGYYRHRAHLLQPVVDRLPGAAARLATRLASGYGADSRSAWGVARNYAARLATTHRKDPFAQYIELVTSSTSPRACALVNVPPSESAGVLSSSTWSGAASLLRAIQATEFSTYLAGDLLPKEDRATMATGLESRVPLLSAQMLEIAERAADAEKISLRGGKLLLREVARRRLPRYVIAGRKRGFAVPLRDLFAGPWRGEAADWLASGSSPLVDRDAAAGSVARGELPPTDVWALAVLVAWESALSAARSATAGARSLT